MSFGLCCRVLAWDQGRRAETAGYVDEMASGRVAFEIISNHSDAMVTSLTRGSTTGTSSFLLSVSRLSCV